MIILDKKYKNIPELFNNRILNKYPNLEKIKTKNYSGINDVDFYYEDKLTYYKCFCDKREIVEHYNYEEGMGSDIWIYCDCKDCIKKLKKENKND